MNDEEIKKLFDQVQKEPVDENEKARTLSLALSEFSKTQEEEKKNVGFYQGIANTLRLIFQSQSNDRRFDMANTDRKWVIGGLSGVALSLLVFVLVGNTPLSRGPDDSQIVSEDFVEMPKGDEQPFTAQGASAMQEERIFSPSLRETASPARTKKLAMNEPWSVVGAGAMDLQSAKSFTVNTLALQDSFIEHEQIPNSGYQEVGRDQFEKIDENSVKLTREEPVSTFSIDVDTASYSFVRGQLNRGILPQKNAVRTEEMVNYFDYDFPLPENKSQPFQPTIVVSDSPWSKNNKLISVGIKGYELPQDELKKTNLVFLLDVSGSMNHENKLPLVKQSLEMLLSRLRPDDTVGIVVYAGAAGTVLEPTPIKEKQKIIAAMKRLTAGGATDGGSGIKLAYQLAEANFKKEAVNRIIWATDGDFNVGISNREELKGFIERKRDKGIYLSILGFGQGNYNDHMMQVLAQNGNGVAAYIDTLGEAQKVLVHEASSTLFPIAKDVKIQLEFNPESVAEYRLIGYETRHLNREDFNNDAVDAGDIGAGHSVTAVYEITPASSQSRLIDDRRYGKKSEQGQENADEYGFLKIRYKLPEQSKSKLITQVIPLGNTNLEKESALKREIGFTTAVVGFSQILKGSKFVGSWSFDDVIELAQENKGADEFGYRTEFVQLVRKAKLAAEM